MRRMVRALEFDICEMAFTTYLCAKAYGKPITAIPVPYQELSPLGDFLQRELGN